MSDALWLGLWRGIVIANVALLAMHCLTDKSWSDIFGDIIFFGISIYWFNYYYKRVKS